MNIVVTGSVAYDYIMTFPGYFKDHILPDKIELLSISFLVDTMQRQRGGVASNIAYNLALLGEHPLLMATVGIDFEEYRQWLELAGVDTRLTRVIADEFTASFFVTTDQSNNQIASFYTGAMAYAHTLSLYELPRDLVDLVIISPNDPRAMIRYAAECHELGIPYIYDPSQQIPRLSGEELVAGIRGARILIVNDYEFEMIGNKTGLAEADILRFAETLIVTRGAEGSTIYTPQAVFQIPPAPSRRIADPTGVGDAYRAGLIKGLALGLPWNLVGCMASLAATYALEEVGPQRHRYSLPEFVQRFRGTFGDHAALTNLRQSETAQSASGNIESTGETKQLSAERSSE